MDATLVAFLFIGGTLLFAILAIAKDREGKRYWVKRMALLWFAALPYFLSSAFEFTAKHADGTIESVKITHSTWFLLIMPGAMIADNITRRKRAKQSPEGTLGKENMTAPAIKLMPDYQCWPLWHHGGKQIGNINPREIDISDELASDLESWAEVYESHLNWSDPASTKWTEEEERQFDTSGRSLCIRLAAEAGSRFSIFYFDPKSALCIPASELI